MVNDLAIQARNAINFVKKLHTEISYLIKEIEGMLLEEDERFLILKPGGYSVTARTSNSLDSAGVDLWMPKDFTVFFCSEEFVESSGSTTNTKVIDTLKSLFIHIKLIDSDIAEPMIIFGILNELKAKRSHVNKVESMVGEFTYSGKRIFGNSPIINFNNSYWIFKGKYKQIKLFSINNSKDIKKKIIEPMLKLYRNNSKAI